MASSFPAALDVLTNPTASDKLNSPPHAEQHANANDCIEAIEATLGVNTQGAAASVAARLSAIEGLVAVKTIDQSVVSSTVLVSDTALTLVVEAGQRYEVDAMMFIDTDGGGVKLGLGGTCTATSVRVQAAIVDSAGLREAARLSALGATVNHTAAGAGPHMATLAGMIVINTAGTLLVSFGQNTSNVDPTTMQAFSMLKLRKR